MLFSLVSIGFWNLNLAYYFYSESFIDWYCEKRHPIYIRELQIIQEFYYVDVQTPSDSYTDPQKLQYNTKVTVIGAWANRLHTEKRRKNNEV